MLTAINVKSRERERGGKKEGNLDTCRTKKLRRQSKILTPSLGARGGVGVGGGEGSPKNLAVKLLEEKKKRKRGECGRKKVAILDAQEHYQIFKDVSVYLLRIISACKEKYLTLLNSLLVVPKNSIS